MSHEIEMVDKEIGNIQSHKKEVPVELEDRKANLETAMTLMQVKASSGEIDQNVYLANLKKKSEEQRAKAKEYLHNGKKDLAILALQRAKVMEKEIEATNEDQK